MLRRTIFAALTLTAGAVAMHGMVTTDAHAQAAPGTAFSTGQAQRGVGSYSVSCAGCHGTKLEGMAAAPLIGEEFRARFANAQDVYDYARTNMPADNPGGLPESTYLNAVAFIFQANGKAPADGPDLTPTGLAKVLWK